MSIIVRNGVTYDTNDLRNYAAYDIIAAGTGDEQERFIAILTDSIADAGNALTATSSTSLTIGTGSKAWTLDADIPVTVGLRFSAIDSVTPANKMHGEITAYDSGTKLFTGLVDIIEGSGTIDTWDMKAGVGATGVAGGTDIVDDTTPQLGGSLDVNGNPIVSVSDGDIDIIPDGTGEINLDGPTVARSPIITDSTTSRTLGLTDGGNYIRFTNAAAIAVTVPTNAATAFPIGTEIIIIQAAAGVITVDHASVTVNSKDSNKASNGQSTTMCLKKVATDTWDLFGDLA